MAPDDHYNRLRMVDQYTRALHANLDLAQATRDCELAVQNELQRIRDKLDSAAVVTLDAQYLQRIEARIRSRPLRRHS